MTATRSMPAAIAAALVAAAWVVAAHAAHTTQPPQTVQRPGETTPGPSTAGSHASAPAGVIRGRIVGADGQPLRAAQIRLLGSRARDPRNETSDADGRYEAGGLPADSYVVTASKTGYAGVEFGQRRPSFPGTRVKVGDGEIVERVDFILPRAGVITGRVSDENGDPVEGATVSLLQVQFRNGRRALAEVGRRRRTNDLGRVRLYGLQPGGYVVAAAAAAVGPYRLPGYSTTYYPGSASVGDAQFVTVGAGENLTTIELRLAQGRVATVSGTALDPTGQPYRGRVVLAGSERSGALAMPSLETAVQRDGRFEFINVAPGDYVLQTIEVGAFAGQYVSVADGDVTGLTLRASAGSIVRGHITVDGAASRLTPQDVRMNFALADADLGPPPGIYRAKINDDWTFEYAGLFGPLLIRPVATAEWLTKSVTVNGADITDTAVLFGSRDQSLGDVDVVLTNRGAEATGAVTDARGQPVAACAVLVFAANRDRWQRHTRFVKTGVCDADGTFTIRGLPAADYFVAAVDRLDDADGSGDSQDPALLESLAQHASRVALTEGQAAAVAVRLAVR